MDLDAALPLLAADPSAPLDVAELAFAVARDEYPELDAEAEMGELTGLAREVRPRLRGGLTARVEALSRYLFHDLGFTGNVKDYYDPRNSYLNDVLARRTGLPITLSLVAMAIGSRAGLRVSGVGLPGHFVAKAVDRGQEVIFDPFHGGRILSPGECAALVSEMVGGDYALTEEAFATVAAGPFVLRMLTNLKGAYLRRRDFGRAARTIGRLVQLCPRDATLRRDQGTVLLQAGRAGQAIDHLRAYLDREPPPEDSRSVRELLDQASGEVARWN